MNPIVRNEDQQFDSEDEISILDILRFFIDGWKAMLSFTVIGALLGIGYVAIETPQYRATAIIEPAYVGTPTPTPTPTPTLSSTLNSPVESIEMLRRKLKSPSYYSSETYQTCGFEGMAKDGDSLTNTLIPPTAKKDAPIDQIEFISNSKDTNIKCLTSVLDDIRRDHEKLKEPFIKSMENKITNLELRLDEAKREKFSNDRKILDLTNQEAQKYPAATQYNLLIKKETDATITQIANELDRLKLGLSEPQTRSARFVTPIYASEIRVDSKRMMKVMAAIFIGLLFSIIYLVGKKYSAKLKEISKPTE
jgi:hypothetical protein